MSVVELKERGPQEFIRGCWLADINRYDCKMYLYMGGWRMDAFVLVDNIYNSLERAIARKGEASFKRGDKGA